MTIKIAFNDTPPAQALDLDTPGVREDRRTGQFVPTVNGKDVSPTSYDPERAMDIAKQTIAQHRRRLELALAALGKGDLDTVKQWVKRMEDTL